MQKEAGGAGKHEEERAPLKDMECGPPPQEGTAGGQSYEGGGRSLSSQVPDTHWGSLLSSNSHLESISYRVQKGRSTESSPETPMSTLPRRNMESIGLGMARTGGMVVITVLLSVAMFLLVVGLIIALALGARK
ncbi:uroplakin-2 [Onychomys torridus]|uniref:uroplakin-2 n=1 Tax=Onychomys torridus TaxID=38674 RepID=UPI00167FA570|nr:uroplakin-2 [Onychomys torridus]